MGHISSLFNGAAARVLASQRDRPGRAPKSLAQGQARPLNSTWAQGSYKYDTQIKPVHPRGTAQGRRGDHGGVASILGRQVWCLAARVVDDPGRRTVAVGGAPRHARQHGHDPRQGGARLR